MKGDGGVVEMGRGLNKVMLIGNLGRDPEMRYTPSGKPVTSFSLASSRSWVSSDGDRREETEWFNVVAWGNLAEICNQHLARGQQVYIEGRLQTRSWEDSNGQRHFRTEVVANEMIILGKRVGYNNYSEENDYGSTEDDLF
jgi:single-strand DNA-binding protein